LIYYFSGIYLQERKRFFNTLHYVYKKSIFIYKIDNKVLSYLVINKIPEIVWINLNPEMITHLLLNLFILVFVFIGKLMVIYKNIYLPKTHNSFQVSRLHINTLKLLFSHCSRCVLYLQIFKIYIMSYFLIILVFFPIKTMGCFFCYLSFVCTQV